MPVGRRPQPTAMTRPPLPLYQRSYVSDSDERSPWARKTILSFDGGGIKGYSSLLIMKRLMYLVEQIERGLVPGEDVSDPDPLPERDQYYAPNSSSEDYSWNPAAYTAPSDRRERALEPAETRAVSVKKTFSGDYDASSAFKPHHYFDYFVGTSTGGLSAIMLGRMELDVDTALKQYDTVGNQVFGHPRLAPKYISASSLVQPKYASWRMEKALQEVTKAALQEEMQQWGTSEKTIPFQSDAERSRTIVVARGKNLARKNGVTWRPYLFRTFDHLPPAPFAPASRKYQHLNPGHAHRMPIWQVARATSAAPTFFEPLKAEGYMFKDGGLGTNNPASVALQEVTQLHEQKPLLLLSIGTGRASGTGDSDEDEDGTAVDDDNVVLPGGPRIPSFLEPFFENLAVIKFMQNLVTETEQIHEHMLDRFEDEANAFASTSLSSSSFSPFPHPPAYHRLNVSSGIGRVIPLDGWSPSSSGARTKDAMLAATIAYLSQRKPDEALHATAQLLVRLRRRRAATERWERFAARYAYYCPERGCPAQGHGFESRAELRAHAQERHGFWVRGGGTGVRGAACVAGRGWACWEEGCWSDGDDDGSPSPPSSSSGADSHHDSSPSSSSSTSSIAKSDDANAPQDSAAPPPPPQHQAFYHARTPRTGGPRTFLDEAAYRAHLERDHRIDWDKFGSRRDAEAWLDSGRILRKRAWRNLQRSGTLGSDQAHHQGTSSYSSSGGASAAVATPAAAPVEGKGEGEGEGQAAESVDGESSQGEVERLKRDVVKQRLQLSVWKALLDSRRTSDRKDRDGTT